MRTYGTLTMEDGLWVLETEPHVTVLLKRIFGRVQPTRSGSVGLSDTPSTAADIDWLMSRYPLNVDAVTGQRLRQRLRSHREQQETAERIMAGARLEYERAPSREPRPHQVSAADLAVTTGRLLLTDPLGGMKSFSSLLTLRHPEALPALVVCPAHLGRQWEAETLLSFAGLRPHIVRTRAVYDPARHRSMKGHDPDVLITTYNKLDAWSAHLAGRIRTALFDEAQELRRSGSYKYQAAGQVADRSRVNMGMTTTPIYNYGDEIFNVLDVLASGCLGTRAEFYQEWCTPIGTGKHRVNDPLALNAYLRDQRLILGRSAKECGIDLDKPEHIPQLVDADEKTLERMLADDGALALAEAIVSADSTKQERWLAAGDLDWKVRRATGVAKAPFVAAFVRMLLDSEQKVLLLGWHRDVYEIWQELFDRWCVGHVLYTGTESPAAKEKAKQAFVTSPHCRVMVMSLRSGVGLDGLERTGCHVAVFGELDWSPGVHDQCLGRLNRGTQANAVLGYFLHCESGSDPVVMETLGMKRGQARVVNAEASLFQHADTSGDKVRRLAEAVLARRRR